MVATHKELAAKLAELETRIETDDENITVLFELQTRKMLQQLIEQTRDLYHGGALLGDDQRCPSNIILKPLLQEGNY
jgi:hypothetical protein